MDHNIITIRRVEVANEVKLLRERIEALLKEDEELLIAENVFARLSGASGSEVSSPNKQPPSKAPEAKLGGLPTVRNMIKEALMDAQQRGLPGLLPRDIRAYIQDTYSVEIGQQINTTASRMWHVLEEIEKDEESGLFRLPTKEKPADAVPARATSTGLFDQPEAQGREAGPGGGA